MDTNAVLVWASREMEPIGDIYRYKYMHVCIYVYALYIIYV